MAADPKKTKVAHLVLDAAGHVARVYIDGESQACAVAAAIKGVVVEVPVIADYRPGHT